MAMYAPTLLARSSAPPSASPHQERSARSRAPLPQRPRPHVAVTLLVPPQASSRAAASYTAGFEFKLERGWHISTGSTQATPVSPPRVTWTLPPWHHRRRRSSLSHPAAPAAVAPLMDYGYENQVLFPRSPARRRFDLTPARSRSRPNLTGSSAVRSACRAGQCSP